MKNLLLLFVFVFGLGQVSLAQNYQFKKIQDDPDFVADKIIGVSCVGPLTYAKNTSMTLGAGLDGIWSFNPLLQAHGTLNLSPIVLDGKGWGSFVELGGAMKLFSYKKQKDVKVVLSYSESTQRGLYTETRTTTVKYIESEATFKQTFKLRAGTHLYRTFYTDTTFAMRYKARGIYGGLEFETKAALVSSVDGDAGITSGLTRVYVDALMLPSVRIDTTGVGPGIGWRAGFISYLNPNRSKKSSFGKLYDYQMWPKLYFKVEGGVRPKEGWFATIGAGFILYKNR